MALLLQNLVIFLLFIIRSYGLTIPSAVTNGTKWINNDKSIPSFRFSTQDQILRPILLQANSPGISFAAAFYCKSTFKGSACDKYVFGVFIVATDKSGIVLSSPAPQLIWAANRDRPVGLYAALDFSKDGTLVLSDADRKQVWSTGSASKRVVGLNITSAGNLLLRDGSNNIIWQSFDNPTDVLVPSQILKSGTKMYASASSTNYSTGPYYLTMENPSLAAYASASPSQRYCNLPRYYANYVRSSTIQVPYAKYQNGSIQLFVSSLDRSSDSVPLPTYGSKSIQYLKLEPSGRIMVYQYDTAFNRYLKDLTGDLDTCQLPGSCGKYGVCKNGRCNCLNGFRSAEDPRKGCTPIVSMPSCIPKLKATFLVVDGLDYFANDFSSAVKDSKGKDLSSAQCQESCLNDCNCKAAFYRTYTRKQQSLGQCYTVLNELYTMRYTSPSASKGFTGFIKLKVRG